MRPDICKIKKRKDLGIKDGGQGKIFVTKKGEIIKTIKRHKDDEKYNLILLKKKLTKRDSIFFNPHIHMKTCKDGSNYYLMKKLDGNLIDLTYSNEKMDLKNMLFQFLSGVYILNHKIKLYHNDLFHKGKIRNSMYIENDDKNLIYENNFIKFKIGKHLVKIIDFGKSNKKPKFMTLIYKNKYFKELKLTSEVFLSMYYYFESLNLKNNDSYNQKLEEKVLNLGKKLEKKSNYNLKIFDQMVIKYIKNNFNSYLNLVI
jgi:hypothetical protein